MSDDASNKPGPFDLHTLKVLAALMSRHDLSELDLSDGDRRIRLRRGPRQSAAPLPLPLPTTAPAPTHPAAAPADTHTASKPTKQLLEIKSSMVGTFYSRDKPEVAPYVTIGSKVTPGTIVGKLEAMKVFNEIPAECSGVIVEILVENQQFVEYGQVLFRVDPTG